jgi:hypothetical protein
VTTAPPDARLLCDERQCGPEGVGRDRDALVPAGYQALPLDPTLALGNPSHKDEDEE